MFDVAVVTRALAGSGQDAPEAGLQEILRLGQGAEYAAAASRADALLRAGSTDIRVVGAFLQGAFVEQGPAALPAIFEALTAAVASRWEAVRPTARRERIVDSALSALFRGVKAMIDFHERARDATWTGWIARVGADLAGACAAAASRLEAAINAVIERAQSAQELAGLRTRAETYFQRLPPAPAAEAAAPAEAAPAAAPAEPEAPPEEPAPAVTESAPPPAPPAPQHEALYIEVSPALEAFLRKLEAFEALVKRGDMGKAAVVAQDIDACVQSFDPRVYLPKLFMPYFRLLSANIGAIAPHWHETDSAAWRALEQLYRVDLDAFLEA